MGRSFIMLGWLDSNQRMAESKSAALPLGYTPSKADGKADYRGTEPPPVKRRKTASGGGFRTQCAAMRRFAPRYRALQYESERLLTMTPWLELA